MFVIPEVINTILMGVIFMVIVVTIVRPLMLNLVKEYTGPNMQEIIIEEIELKIARRAQQLAQRRADMLEFHRQLALPPPSLYALPAPAVEPATDDWDEDEDDININDQDALSDQLETQEVPGEVTVPTPQGEPMVNENGEVVESPADEAADNVAEGEGDIEIREGETLADIKARLKKEKEQSSKQTIPPELLNNAKSYEDKVGVVRMVVQQDHSRVAAVIRSMIQTSNK
jgi:hypothetical protein